MTDLYALWLPILLSSILVFVVSSIIHMMLPWHSSDYPRLANQDQIMDALRPLAIPPGGYMIPMPSKSEDMASAEFAEKMKKGPVLILQVMPSGPWPMGRNLSLWLVYLVVVGLFAAYVAGLALPAGADAGRVMKFTGVTAFVGYTAALWQMSIWYRRSLSITVKATVDGAIYSLVTAGLFAWLWPR